MEFILCILVTTCIGVCFKLFTRFGVNSFNAIIINYTICLILGTLLDPSRQLPYTLSEVDTPWFKYTIILGILFITGFNLAAIAIKQVGITTTTLMQRMSLIITVAFTVILFHEHFGLPEFLGLLLALMAILAITRKTRLASKESFKFPLILISVLGLSAMIEMVLYYVEKTNLIGQDQMAFTTHGFGNAAIIGWLIIGWLWIKGKVKISGKDWIAGIVLGLPNFFSIYFILVMLNQGWKGSIMYPLINVSVLLSSTIVAVVIFHEKLTRINWIGIGLATAAILLITYAHNAPDWKISF